MLSYNLHLTGLECYINGTKLIASVVGVVPPDELCDPAVARLMHSMLELKLIETDQLCLVPLVPSIITHGNS